MQARYYDPAIGRFLSIDPVGFSVEQPFMFGRYTYVNNDPVNLTDPTGQCPNCVTGAIGAGIGGVFGLATSTFAELTDGKPGVSLGNIAKSTGKGIAVGGATGFAGPAAGVATAAVLGGADGAITAAVEGGSAGEIVANGLAGAVVEGGATFLGGAGAAKLLPPSLKQSVVGEVLSIGAATGANAAISQAPGVANSVSEGIQGAGQAISDTVGQLQEMAVPEPMIDPMERDR
jgi:hypothetical protein